MRKIEKLLENTDFSRDSENREEIKMKLMRKLEEQEERNRDMNNAETKNGRRRLRPATAVAAALAATLAFSAIIYGGDIIKIIKEYSVGEHAKFVVTERVDGMKIALPEELRGVLFDADGNELENYPEEGEMFLASGERAMILASNEAKVSEDGKVSSSLLIAVPESEAKEAEQRLREEKEDTAMTFFDSVEDAGPYLAFDFLMPAALPEGFAVSRVYMFNDDKGQLPPKEDCKYLSYEMLNADGSEYIYVQYRLMDSETAFVGSASDEMRDITVNGYPGVIDGLNLDVEIDGVMYMFMAGKTTLTEKELIAMAESLR